MQIHELNNFIGKPGEFDFLAIDNGYDTAKIGATKLLGNKLNQPLDGNGDPDNGTSGQLLRTNGDGSTDWVDEGLPTDAQTAAAVTDWLNDHPEATTTVQDGAITDAKLNSALRERIVMSFQDVSTMKASTELLSGAVCHTEYYSDPSIGGGAWYSIKNTGTANGMDVIALDSGLFAHLMVLDNRITPEMLGYTSGDAWTFIKRCIESDAKEIVLNGSYTITHNDGTYSGGLYVGNQITANDKYIHGTGSIFVTPDASNWCPFVFLDTSNLVVEGITITSDMTQYPGEIPSGHQRTANSSNVIGFATYGTCDNIVFSNIKFDGCHWCFSFKGLGSSTTPTNTNIIVENCHSINSGGMFVNCDHVDGLTIRDCSNDVIPCVGGMHFLYAYSYIYNIEIDNCYANDHGYNSPAIQSYDSSLKNGGSVIVRNSTFVTGGLTTSYRKTGDNARITFENCDVTLVDRYTDAITPALAYSFIVNRTNDDAVITFNNCKFRGDPNNTQNMFMLEAGSSLTHSDETYMFRNCTIESDMAIVRAYILSGTVIVQGCHFTSPTYHNIRAFDTRTGDGTMKIIDSIFDMTGIAAPANAANQIVEIINCLLNTSDTGLTPFKFMPSTSLAYLGKFVFVGNICRNMDISRPSSMTDYIMERNTDWSNS